MRTTSRPPLPSTSAAQSFSYTDAPLLHPNFFLGSLQLLGWLFFRPTAWRAQLARIDRTLSPIFCLAELSRTQWRNPALRRFMLQCHLLLILLILLGILGVLFVDDLKMLADDLVVFMSASIMNSLALGVVFQMSALVPAFLILALPAALGSDGFVLTPLIFGIMGSIAGNLMEDSRTISFARRLGGLVIGLGLGGITAGLLLALEPVERLIFYQLGLGVIGSLAIVGLLLSLALVWRTQAWQRSVLFGLGFTVIGAVILSSILLKEPSSSVDDVLSNLLVSWAVQAFYYIAFAISYQLIAQIAGAWTGIVAGLLALALADSTTYAPLFNSARDWATGLSYLWLFLVGLMMTWWRPILLYPLLAAWNTLLYYADRKRWPGRASLLRWHSACWDELQRLPWPGLDEHLLWLLEKRPIEGQAALNYVAHGHQRWAVQAAQIELDARLLERCHSIADISLAMPQPVVGNLIDPANTLLRSFGRLSQNVAAALNLVNTYHQRLALSSIEEQLDNLLRELTRSSESYAQRFRPIALHWGQLIAQHRQTLAQLAEQRQEIDNPYVVGVPLSVDQAIFVGRTDLSAQLETLLLDRQCPPLLLYGQRRIGKTSLLNNLGRLITQEIIPLYVDLQGPVTLADSHAGFLAALARAMQNGAQRERSVILPALPPAELEVEPFLRFDAWLDAITQMLEQRTVLLMLDEFEALESTLTAGNLEERAVLGMLRHMIQHRPWLKVLLAGSHTMDEVQRWAAYLINVQVVPLGYLTEAETRELVEHPTHDFVLRYTPEASARIFTLTHGHPALVQLLCATIIATKNRQSPEHRRCVGVEEVMAVIPQVLQRGHLFFADIEHNQLSAEEQIALRALAQYGEAAGVPAAAFLPGTPAAVEPVLAHLRHRDLIEATPGGYRFQVELIRRWFLPARHLDF